MLADKFSVGRELGSNDRTRRVVFGFGGITGLRKRVIVGIVGFTLGLGVLGCGSSQEDQQTGESVPALESNRFQLKRLPAESDSSQSDADSGSGNEQSFRMAGQMYPADKEPSRSLGAFLDAVSDRLDRQRANRKRPKPVEPVVRERLKAKIRQELHSTLKREFEQFDIPGTSDSTDRGTRHEASGKESEGGVEQRRSRLTETEEDNLKDEVDTLQKTVNSQDDAITALAERFDKIERTTINGHDSIVFRGINVHIRNQSGSTTSQNGVGNLIVGYDEGSDTKDGSHNLVIGPQHTYDTVAGLIAGDDNAVTGQGATVTGGQANSASGNYASVSGGDRGETTGTNAVVAGGEINDADGQASFSAGGDAIKALGTRAASVGGLSSGASGPDSFVGGGDNISAIASRSAAVGGQGNQAASSKSLAAGGRDNTVGDNNTSVFGGQNNETVASDGTPYAVIVGGQNNKTGSAASLVMGGNANYARGGSFESVVLGGQDNDAQDDRSAVAGGRDNVTWSSYAAVGGGRSNSAQSTNASVTGGRNNQASGDYSLVVGGNSATETRTDTVASGGDIDVGYNYFLLNGAEGTEYQIRNSDNESSGVSVRTTSNPGSGNALFTVESTGGRTRLRISHNGHDWHYDGLSVDRGNSKPTNAFDVGGWSDMHNNKIVSVANPTNPKDVANKEYTDLNACECSSDSDCSGGTCDGCSCQANCTLDGTTRQHGESATFYQDSSTDCGVSCSSQSRTCQDGSYDGNSGYDNSSCNPSGNCAQTCCSGTCQECCLDSDCASDETCWSGSCRQDCTLDGNTYSHATTVSAYKNSSVDCDQTCSVTARTCIDGSFDGDSSYDNTSCSPVTCSDNCCSGTCQECCSDADCSGSETCSSGSCVSTCNALGTTCSVDSDCCNNNCGSGGNCCIPDGAACTNNTDCCSSICDGGTCGFSGGGGGGCTCSCPAGSSCVSCPTCVVCPCES